jgi:hypothetical protein
MIGICSSVMRIRMQERRAREKHLFNAAGLTRD